jgi:hypothetical protein
VLNGRRLGKARQAGYFRWRRAANPHPRHRAAPPAEPGSASQTGNDSPKPTPACNYFAANGNSPLNSLGRFEERRDADGRNSQPLESDVWPRRQDADRQTKVGGAGACIGSCVLGNSEGGRQQDRSNGERLIGHGHSIRPNPSELASSKSEVYATVLLLFPATS